MSSPVDPLRDTRADDMRRFSTAILNGMPVAAAAILERYPIVADAPVENALAVLFVVYKCERGDTTDTIVEELSATSCFGSTPPAALREEFVLPIRKRYMACALGLEPYFELQPLLFDLVQHSVELMVKAGITAVQIESLARDRWGFDRRDTALAVVEEAKGRLALEQRWSDALAVLSPKFERLEALGKTLGLEQTVEDCLGLCPEGLSRRPELLYFARQMLTCVLAGLAIESMPETESRPARIELDALTESLGSLSSALSSAENALLMPLNPERDLLRRVLLKSVMIPQESRARSALPPDVQKGETLVPDWFVDWVSTQGARFFHVPFGPVPYFAFVHQPGEMGSIDKIGVHPAEIDAESVRLELSLVDRPDDPAHIDFHFSRGSIRHVYELALIAAVGGFRLDIIEAGRNSGWRLLRSKFVKLPAEVLGSLEMAAAESLRAKSLTSLEAVRNALRSNEIGESQDDLAFDAAEHAKCEELLEAVSLLPNSARAGAHRELWARWDQLRRLSLRLDEALRAAGLGDPERSRRLRATIARVSRRRWQRLGRLRHLDPASVSELVGAPRVAALVSDLESPGRVFLHLIFRQGELEGVWARISGDEAVCGRVAFPLFDLGRAIKVVNGWIVAPTPVESRLRLSNVLALLSDTVGRPLEKAILPSGCQHLVISGAWFLDLIPWHCVSVGAGGRMLMDVYGVVSSCPSLRFLRHVKRPPLTASARVTGIAFSPTESPIPGACREVEHLVRQHPGADVFTQKAATIDRVLRSGAQSCILHVACHGSWIPEDPRSSFLWCAPRGDDGGRLRLSRLLAEADFARELELAVLSACHSGTSVQRERTVQEYTGLDVGFLARGARSTISSLWEVDDLVSVLLMARLHELLREGVAIDAALMRAMREWRDGPLLELAENRNRDGALDQLMPGWRDNAAKLVAKASHPHCWGPFRCCGWTWRSIAGIANTQPSGPSSTAPP